MPLVLSGSVRVSRSSDEASAPVRDGGGTHVRHFRRHRTTFVTPSAGTILASKCRAGAPRRQEEDKQTAGDGWRGLAPTQITTSSQRGADSGPAHTGRLTELYETGTGTGTDPDWDAD